MYSTNTIHVALFKWVYCFLLFVVGLNFEIFEGQTTQAFNGYVHLMICIDWYKTSCVWVYASPVLYGIAQILNVTVLFLVFKSKFVTNI